MGGKRKKHKPSYKPPRRSIEESEPPLLVFVSSLIDKMRRERDVANEAIRSIPITRPWLFEYTAASSQEVKESYLSKVRECDIFVLILGSEYSEEVTREYKTAIQTDKHILAFVSHRERDTQQETLIRSIITKRSPYADLDELRDLVYVSVLDEIKRTFRSAIRPSDAPKIIESLPLSARSLEDMSGYVIAGMEGPEMGAVFEMFGAKLVPRDLNELSPSLEPLYIQDLAEMQEAFAAIKNAATRAKATPDDTQKAFIRELKKEASKVASRYMMRLRNQQPAAQRRMPGLRYFTWGVVPDFARLVSLMRPEEIVKGPTIVERSEFEYQFKDANHIMQVLTIMHESKQKAGDDLDEFLRLLIEGAGVMAMQGD